MLTAEQRSEIRRLFYGEHWRIGTIAIQLSLHRSTVERALGLDRFGARGAVRPSALDPFYPLVESILVKYPRLTASRIHRMLEERGYHGSATQLRRFIRKHRRRPPCQEAYLR